MFVSLYIFKGFQFFYTITKQYFSVIVYLYFLLSDAWRKFKEEEDKEKDLSRNRTCEDGIREVVKYLNPDQLDILCTS